MDPPTPAFPKSCSQENESERSCSGSVLDENFVGTDEKVILLFRFVSRYTHQQAICTLPLSPKPMRVVNRILDIGAGC